MKKYIVILLLCIIYVPCFAEDLPVTEGSTSWLTLSFFDEDGNPATPPSARYRIDDVSSWTEIKATTTFIPTEVTYTIKSTPSENRIIDDSRMNEQRLVTVEWTDGVNERTDYYEYYVINLSKIPLP